jgi:hypothetical protein
MQAKLSNGQWLPGFTPGTSDGLVEGTSAQYTPSCPAGPAPPAHRAAGHPSRARTVTGPGPWPYLPWSAWPDGKVPPAPSSRRVMVPAPLNEGGGNGSRMGTTARLPVMASKG